MTDEAIKKFEEAASFTGSKIRHLLLYLPDEIKRNAQEIRLRCGRPLMVSGINGDVFVTEGGRESYIFTQSAVRVSPGDIEECFKLICGYSVYTHQNGICNGYVTVQGGHRAGVAGTAVIHNGEVNSVRDISSVNIRIAKEFKGIADDLFNKISVLNQKSIIIAGPPSSGKTSVLRDLARIFSSESGGFMKTVIVDEREEIAACLNSIPQNDIGISSDVLSGYSKEKAILIALRSMSPQNIIIDEITNEDEVSRIESGLNSGVHFYLTVHACDKSEFLRRKPVIKLLETGEFGAVAFLDGKENPSKIKEFILAGELMNEIGRGDIDCCSDNGIRDLCFSMC